MPQYEYIHQDFVAYRKLEGEGLRKERFDNLDTPTQENVIQSIGAFLTILHNTTDWIDEPMGKLKNQIDFWDSVWPIVETQLSNRCRTNAQKYFKEMDELPYANKLIHGDFKFKHVLFDGERISGILDFGCATVSDPARDIGRISERYGSRFMKQLLLHYLASNYDDTIAMRAEYHRRRGLCFLIFDNNQQACIELETQFG